MSNSPLVQYTKISPNRTSPRNHVIDTVTIHIVVGQVTVERLGDIFASRAREASSNYGIGFDGKIGMYCEEKDRSWCSSSAANDNRAITIEVASDTFHPYKVTDAAYKSLINLLVDICKRNPHIGTLKWQGNKALIGQVDKQNMTVHRWFAAKSCPGDYLYNLHPQIASEVNAILGAPASTPAPTPQPSQPSQPSADSFIVQVIVPDLNYRVGPPINGALQEVVGKIHAPIRYTIVEVKDGWGKLKSGEGWINISPKYVSRVGAAAPVAPPKPAYPRVKVISSALNYRSGAGTQNKILGQVYKNQIFSISKQSNGWGYISGKGWINIGSKYVKRV